MSRIEELIQELCPEGVNYKKIWEVTAWDKKFNGLEKSMQKKIYNYPYVLAKQFKELEQKNGDVCLLSTGQYVGWTTEELAGKYLCEGEVVAIPWGGKANIKYYKGKFVTADNRIATSLDLQILLNKYLYYWMLFNINLIESFYRGSGIKHPSMRAVLTMEIPIPPLPIQQEIVSILDKFTQLQAELETELEARRKQYEYYRDQLLQADEEGMMSSGVKAEWKTLGEIGKVSMCKRVMKHETSPMGDIPFYKIGTFGKNADAFITKELYDEYKRRFSFPKVGDILISASGTIGRTVVYDGKPAYFQDSNIVWIDNDESIVTNEFLFYYYKTVNWIIDGGTISRLYNSNLAKTKILIPPLSEQNRIVEILDKFDTLVNDTSIGIPAEIEARRKQYEYYRAKLLDFKEYES